MWLFNKATYTHSLGPLVLIFCLNYLPIEKPSVCNFGLPSQLDKVTNYYLESDIALFFLSLGLTFNRPVFYNLRIKVEIYRKDSFVSYKRKWYCTFSSE